MQLICTFLKSVREIRHHGVTCVHYLDKESKSVVFNNRQLRHFVPAPALLCKTVLKHFYIAFCSFKRRLSGTYNMGPFRVRLGRPQRLAVLRHIQDVGVQLGSHDRLTVESQGDREREKTLVWKMWKWMESLPVAGRGGLVNKRGGEEEEEEEERGEFGEVNAWLSRGGEERMTKGPAGSGTPHSSSCRSLYPGPTLEKMEE